MAAKRKRATTAKKRAVEREPKKRKKVVPKSGTAKRPAPKRKPRIVAPKKAREKRGPAGWLGLIPQKAKKPPKKQPPKKPTQKKSFKPPKKPTGPKRTTAEKVKGPRKLAAPKSKGPKKQRRPRVPKAKEIAKDSPTFAEFVAQKEKIRELEAQLEEAKAKEFDAAERAAIEVKPEAKDAGITVDQAFEDVVRWLRQDSSPARQPSILRHYLEADEWRRQLQLVSGGDADSDLFRRRARIIARETGVSLREVYTLWWSP
jgi:hypothetical protein